MDIDGYLAMLAGVVVTTVGLAFLWHRHQVRAAVEFSGAVEAIQSNPIPVLVRLTELGKKLSQRQLGAVARDTVLFGALKSCLKSLMSSDEGKAALAEFFKILGARLIRIDAAKTTEIPVAIFYLSPGEWRSHEFGLFLLRHLTMLPTTLSEWVYQVCLQLLESNRESVACKRLVLEVGRWHFGRIRDDKVPTIYDEQAIQNDLLVRAR